jgi:hypothetical protein
LILWLENFVSRLNPKDKVCSSTFLLYELSVSLFLLDGRHKLLDKTTSLPVVEAFQRHELTLLRMEDILNYGTGGASFIQGASASTSSNRVGSAAELCYRMVDFCQRLTTAKRKILEDPELYPEHTRHALPDTDAIRLDQKMRRRRVCEKLSLVPGKLDHATIVAYTVDDRRNAMMDYRGTELLTNVRLPKLFGFTGLQAYPSEVTAELSLRAPCASSEDLTCRESPISDDFNPEQGNQATNKSEKKPTPSLSLCSNPASHNS